MKTSARCVLFCLLGFFVTACNRGSLAQTDTIKSRQIVSRHKAIFNRPPSHVPSFHVVDGPIAGDGDIGLTVSGPPEKQTLWISKNDFWKSGPDFKQCGPSLIGGIDVRIDALKGASYHVEQVLYKPVIASEFSVDNSTVSIDSRVMATENLIVLELAVSDESVQVRLDLWAEEGYGSKTEEGRQGDVSWVTRRFNTGALMYSTEPTIAMRVFDNGGTSFTLKPGKPVTVTDNRPTARSRRSHPGDGYTIGG